MDLKDKIIAILFKELKPEYVRLDDDNGISGFIVSDAFKDKHTLDRQELIEAAFQKAALAPEEKRQVLMIAGVTPEEYETIGARIRVHKVKEMAGGALDILVHGGTSDAEYVRGALNIQKGVQTTDPKPIEGALGVLMHFRAKGTESNPLTKDKAVRILKKDRYIEVMAGV